MAIALTSANPPQATIKGNIPITLTGANFQHGVTVRFGGTEVDTVRVDSATQITVTAPARTLCGTVQLTVRHPDGSNATLGFHYRPLISKVEPADGPTAGGTDITITGEGFHIGVSVEIHGAVLAVRNVTATRMIATTVAHAAGKQPVDVYIPGRITGTRWNDFWFCAPLVSGVTPSTLPIAGGGNVTIRGNYFSAGATVQFGATPSPLVNRNSATELTAQVPAHAAGRVNVVVTHPADGTTGSLPNAVEYAGAAILGIDPPRGPAAGGTRITLRCERLAAGAQVHVGGQLANNIVVTLPDRVSADTPAGAVGRANVSVSNPLENAGTGSHFEYVAAATVTGVSPAFGLAAGGTAISIAGNGFVDGALVSVGGVAATHVVVQSGNTITATTPQHAAGQVDVAVRNPGGAEHVLAGGYEYTDIAGVQPALVRIAGGINLDVLGRFARNAVVRIGGNPAHKVTQDNTRVRVIAPMHADGVVDVEVEAGGVTTFLRAGITYSDLLGITPVEGPLGGGTQVTITGRGFALAPVVSIGGQAAAVIPGSTATSVTATTPAGLAAGTVDVVVDGMPLAAAFTYRAPATVTRIVPAIGPATGGSAVTIEGSGFHAGAAVSIGGTAATDVQVVSPTTIKARTAAHAAGQADVQVDHGGLAGVPLAGAFTFRAAPTVTAVTPAHGPTLGGRVVTITGTDFVDGARVMVDGVEATSVVHIDAQHISARVPPHIAGQVGIGVANPGEAAGPVLANAFDYRDGPPGTGNNEAVFLLDGDEYFSEFRQQLEAVLAAPVHPLTYVRMAFWMIDVATCVGNGACQGDPQHTLLSYIDRIIRAGHGVDIIAWQPNQIERPINNEAGGVAAANGAFAQAIADLDAAAVQANPRSGKARIYMELYEGVIGCSNHQKMVIFSLAGQRTVLLGGLNLSPIYYAPTNHRDAAGNPRLTWHDAAIRLRGPATEDVENEWMRRWRRTSNIAASWNLFGGMFGDGDVKARAFAFNTTTTIRQAAVNTADNTTAQVAQVAGHTVAIATTRSVGNQRYTSIRDQLLARINAADDYVYMENYHFTDPDIVRALYERQDARQQAGHELRVVIIVPRSGGASGYMTRRSWLQMALRFVDPANTPYTTDVEYQDEQGTVRQIQRALCDTWNVVDSYDTDAPTATRWLDEDALVFHTAGDPPGDTRVTFDRITKVTGTFYFYTSVYGANHGRNIYNHSKVAVIDDRYLLVGSSNWSYRSMQYDGEMTAFIDNPALAQASLARLFAHYDEHTPTDVNNVHVVADANLVQYIAGTRHAQYILFPLNHHLMPNFSLPRVKPGITSGDHTWY